MAGIGFGAGIADERKRLRRRMMTEATMYRDVTVQELQDSCMAKDIWYVDHHDCSICGEWTRYLIDSEINAVYYDSSCGCSSSCPTPRSWDEVAEFVNMQSQSEIKKEIALRFGIELEVGTTVPGKEE
jgi:hypothetical protein